MIRIDALLLSAIGNIDNVADIAKKELTKEECSEFMQHLGQCMLSLIEFSEAIRRIHPDAVPAHMKRNL